jgi:general stress protein 26
MSKENLHRHKAFEKIKELAESIDFVLMATNLGHQPMHVVPMSTKKVDAQANIWFLSGKDSDHNRFIRQDQQVHLFYSNPSDMEFLHLYGEAQVVDDRDLLQELYQKTDDSWFKGPDDPNLSAIRVTPVSAYYWDTRYNKLVTLFKMGIGAITGEEQDISTEGSLELEQ